ncbi:MAG: hypothetical protein OXK78_16715 [Caldilineaceae bacterium]|nr:hypothetical protein [Caldilineaceae bacterium]
METFDQTYIAELPRELLQSQVKEEGERYGSDSGEKGPSPLETADLASFFDAGGTLSSLMADYELRPSQSEMAEIVKRAILERRPALVEAPTGTGKSLAYLLPAILSQYKVVIATANKSLQDQLFRKDIPFLRRVLNRPIDAIVVKGRNSYICNYKWEKETVERQRLAFLDREDEQVAYLRRWLDDTDSGDVDDLPFVLKSDLRPRVVSFPDDCIGRSCLHFDDNCFVNQMRAKARNAQVIITNHHLLLNALELGEMGQAILPEAAIYVIDEAHQLENTATSVFEEETSNYALEQLLSGTIFKKYLEDSRVEDVVLRNGMAFAEAEQISDKGVFRIDCDLHELKKLAGDLSALQDEMRKANPFRHHNEEGHPHLSAEESEEEANYELAVKGLGSLAGKLKVVASSSRDDLVVRYAERIRGSHRLRLRLHAAPIDPSLDLARHLFDEEGRTVICTSATLATEGSFAHFKARCGVAGEPLELIADPVFNYPEQALLYQPALPAFDWRDKAPFFDAVAAEIERLLNVSRGRALCLFTSWSGLQQVHERLHDAAWPLRAQGQFPRSVLLDWFRETPHSVLLATKSFWEGVDLPGDDLSLVVLDKLPFPTPSDPLHEARTKALEEIEEGSSFRKYMVPLMTLALKQGFGRLIRRTADRGVVAILDERLSSRGYGRQARRDLPSAQFSRSFRTVYQFYREALGSQADFSLSVLAWEEEGARVLQWRWLLTRLQDGLTDEEVGTLAAEDHTEAEIHAAASGLANLRERVLNADRNTGSFGVELRCSAQTAHRLNTGALPDAVKNRWLAESAAWKSLDVIGLPATDEAHAP